MDRYRSIGKDFVAFEDGFYYFWPDGSGAFSSNDLRLIAEQLDQKNASWQAQLDN